MGRGVGLQKEACALPLPLRRRLEENKAHSKGLNNQEDRRDLDIRQRSLLKYVKARNLQPMNTGPRTVPRLQLPPVC